MRYLLLACLIAGCISEHRDARDKYNEGVAALAKAQYEAAEKALLEARSQAGVDPELRFRAAYDLGVAFAAHADQKRIGKDADLAKALELAQQAASWLSDADRLRPGDANTKANLAIVRARVQAIGDELRKGEGKLEVRLDRLIQDQRGVLDEARAAWVAIKQAGGSDPLAQQAQLTHLADRERGIGAEAGVVGDLAADEIDAIGKKPEDKRDDQEKVRVVQLKNLDLYLLEGRTRITEARRKLQELAAEDGVARSEAALVALKRAREQLLDPISVLRMVAKDEVAVLQDTAHSDTGALDLGSKDARNAKAKDAKDGKNAEAPEVLPGWPEPNWSSVSVTRTPVPLFDSVPPARVMVPRPVEFQMMIPLTIPVTLLPVRVTPTLPIIDASSIPKFVVLAEKSPFVSTVMLLLVIDPLVAMLY